MKSEKILIGLIGEKGSGKETVGDSLMKLMPSKKIIRIRSSDVLAKTLTDWGLPLNRHNLQHLAIVMDGGFGKGTLSTAVKKHIETMSADVVIFDGIRWETDVELVRSFKKNLLVYVTADLKTRYDRIIKRKEKVGEGAISYEQFLKEEEVDTETHIPELAKKADKRIENNGTLLHLQDQVQKLIVDIAEGVL